MKVHMVSELSWLLKGNGVNTAFLQLVDLLTEHHAVQVVINGQGRGDVYHSHSYGFFYFLRGLGYKGRRILTVHVIPDSARGSIPGARMLMPLLRWYFKKVYTYADVCIALSPMVEKAILETGAKTRIERIHNPIPIDFWRRTDDKRAMGRKMLDLQEDDFVVLGVGQIEGRKGVEDFLSFTEEIPEAKFVWAGGRPFGPLTEGLQRINALMAKAPKQVKFPGMFDLKEMPYIYAAADLFVFPSFQENCPMAPMEAAAAGLPVIFRDLPEYKLLYKNPYIRATSTEDFITEISRMIEDHAYYKKGIEISTKLLEQFDKDQIRDRIIALYHNLS